MKSGILFGLGLLALASSGTAAVNAEIDRFVRMGEIVHNDGVGSLLRVAATERWTAPEIPSPWRIASAPDGETRRLWEAAKTFGVAAAIRLARDASALRESVVGSAMVRQAGEHVEFAHWVAATEGYGNGFLAQRAADLAAVACARMTADMRIELSECTRIAERLVGVWTKPDWLANVLNREAGTDLFRVPTQEGLVRTWRLGVAAVSRERVPAEYRSKLPSLTIPREIGDQLSFFQNEQTPSAAQAHTLVATLESKWHMPLALGMQLASVNQALALLEFRTAIGFFPEKRVIRPPTKEQQVAIEWAKEWEKKHGADPRVKTSPAGSHYKSEQEAAFDQVWKEKIEETIDRRHPDYNQRWNRHVTAWMAFDRVQRGVFVDREAEELVRWKLEEATRQRR